MLIFKIFGRDEPMLLYAVKYFPKIPHVRKVKFCDIVITRSYFINKQCLSFKTSQSFSQVFGAYSLENLWLP